MNCHCNDSKIIYIDLDDVLPLFITAKTDLHTLCKAPVFQVPICVELKYFLPNFISWICFGRRRRVAVLHACMLKVPVYTNECTSTLNVEKALSIQYISLCSNPLQHRC